LEIEPQGDPPGRPYGDLREGLLWEWARGLVHGALY